MSLLATAAAVAASAFGLGSPPALTPPVAAVAARAPQRPLTVIVQQRHGADATGAVRAAGGTVLRRVDLIDGLVVRLPAARASRLAAAPAVRAVSVDAAVAGAGRTERLGGDLETAYNQSIRADRAWGVGATGTGIGVAVIDTGIQGDLPDFRASRLVGRSRVVVNAVVNPSAGSAGDDYGHGTHIAGLIAGNGFNRPLADPLRGQYVGVAPGAHLIAVKSGDEDGAATVLDIIDGLQFVVDHKADYGIRVVNLSLSSRVAESHLTDPLDAAGEAAWRAGIVVVAAAGNRGEADDAVSYAPGNDPWVISVGGVDDMGTRTIEDDTLASWSSRGVTQDGHAKPDVVAPGAHLVSTMPAGAAYRAMCPQCVVDGDYFRVGGTSMAAGVVSGAVADILQVHPDWSPDQVKRALVKRSRPVLDHSDDPVDASGEEVDGAEATDTIDGGEVAIDKVLRYYARRDPWPANRNLAASGLLDPVTGGFDYTRTSLTRAQWGPAAAPLLDTWSAVGWLRTSLTAAPFEATEASCIELARTSLTRTSLTRTSLTGAELDIAQATCDALLTAIEPTRTSLTRTSLTRTSLTWASSFSK